MLDFIIIPLAVVAGFVGTNLLIKRFPSSLLRENFQGRLIPNAFGLVFVIAGEIYYGSKYIPGNVMRDQAALAYLVALLGFGLLGLIDDVAGDRSVGGLGGHLRALLRERRVTTGLIKAGGGILLGCWCASLTPTPHAPWLIRAIVIAGAANVLNLIDLRPGRCLAFFFVAVMPVLVYVIASDLLSPSHLFVAALPMHFALLTAAVLYFRESKADFMLGDTGSNAFGGVLGLSYVVFAPGTWQWVAAILVIAFHVWTERHSFSTLIERNAGLRAFDRKIGVR